MSEVEVPVAPGTGRASGPVKTFIAGGVGGVGLIVTGHPFDTVKVLLQTHSGASVKGEPALRGAMDCVRSTLKSEGPTGLYRGMLAPLMAAVPYSAISFFGYWVGKRVQQSSPDEVLTLRQHFQAGMISGLISAGIVVPTDRVKCTMQVQRKAGGQGRYSGSFDCARQLYGEGGLRNMYRGAAITLLREIPTIGVFFFTYEGVLRSLTPPGKSQHDLSPGRVLLGGGTAGFATWVFAIVPDNLKSRIQSAPQGRFSGSGIQEAFREVVTSGGPRALFRGLGPALLRSFPANAACLLCYEATLKALNLVW